MFLGAILMPGAMIDKLVHVTIFFAVVFRQQWARDLQGRETTWKQQKKALYIPGTAHLVQHTWYSTLGIAHLV